MLKILKEKLYAIKKTIIRRFLVKRSKNDHATHLPVLLGISKIYKIKKVIEFGSGNYSTLAFLDREAFPDLISLKFYENNLKWHKKISHILKNDKRAEPNYVKGEISEHIEPEIISQADLVFIDDSNNSLSRSKTISKVCEYIEDGIIIIHDYEVPIYVEKSKIIKHSYNFNSLIPNTGILSNKIEIKKWNLNRINLFIWCMKNENHLHDLYYWNDKFKKYKMILFN